MYRANELLRSWVLNLGIYVLNLGSTIGARYDRSARATPGTPASLVYTLAYATGRPRPAKHPRDAANLVGGRR